MKLVSLFGVSFDTRAFVPPPLLHGSYISDLLPPRSTTVYASTLNRLPCHAVQVRYPRSGMSSELGLYTRTGGKTHKCSACSTCDLKDYTGSYHVSISLPHDPEGWILYDEEALSEDCGTCSETYVRECGHDGETPLSVWVDAHAVSEGSAIQNNLAALPP